MKQHNKRSHSHRIAANKRAFSTVISTIILTSVLLIILVVASFVSLNILSNQMASTEFDIAKSNMLLLDSTIQDVALRPGAGGYVQFNEREGGIGIYKTTDNLTISATNGSIINSANYTNLVQLVYSGGSLASAAVDQSEYNSLRGNQSTNVTLTQSLGFLRLEQFNGAKIKLDYDRVRIVSNGIIDSQGTNLIQITFIHLINGTTSGSGTVNVQVQNIQTNTTIWQFSSPAQISISIQPTTTTTPTAPQTQPIPGTYRDPTPADATKTVVIFSEIQVRVSIT